MRIILDTNFLINCAKFHLDYCEQLKHHSLYTLDAVVGELENLINQKNVGSYRRVCNCNSRQGIKKNPERKKNICDKAKKIHKRNKMNSERIGLTWKDIINLQGNYFSGLKEMNSRYYEYEAFSQLPLELGAESYRSK